LIWSLQKNLKKKEDQTTQDTNAEEEYDDDYGAAGCCCLTLSYLLAIISFPFGFCGMFNTVSQFERSIVLRLGKFSGGLRNPGIFCYLPCTDEIKNIDIRVKTYHVPSQEVLTSDSVTILVNAVIYFRVEDPIKSYFNVENCEEATKLLAQTTLRSVISSKSLTSLLVKRSKVSAHLQQIMDKVTKDWGINVSCVEIRDIILPQNMQRSMAAEAEASRVAKAKIIAAEGEAKAAANLAKASITMAQSPGAMQLRYLQTLTAIGAEKNSTIVFPIPVEVFEGVQGLASTLFGGLTRPSPPTNYKTTFPDAPVVMIEDEDDKGKSKIV